MPCQLPQQEVYKRQHKKRENGIAEQRHVIVFWPCYEVISSNPIGVCNNEDESDYHCPQGNAACRAAIGGRGLIHISPAFEKCTGVSEGMRS